MLEIVTPGPFACVQDAGRHGYAALGVPRSGAFDQGAYRLANRLVGNEPGAAALEIVLGGLVVRMHDATSVALTGAACPGDLDWGVATTVPAGAIVRLLPPPSGLRSYLAVRGGIAARPELGSRSTDSLSGLGPRPLRAGDLLHCGPEPASVVSGAAAVAPSVRAVAGIVPGPRDDWFTPTALEVLTTAPWTVLAESNRIGVRLAGPSLPRLRTEELASEPTLPGAIQVPPGGGPIVFGPDAPVTGGYPVLAVVRTADVDVFAQLRPGETVRFSR
jgi:biotin-dependent carboxylase-like uncharacterized protein